MVPPVNNKIWYSCWIWNFIVLLALCWRILYVTIQGEHSSGKTAQIIKRNSSTPRLAACNRLWDHVWDPACSPCSAAVEKDPTCYVANLEVSKFTLGLKFLKPLFHPALPSLHLCLQNHKTKKNRIGLKIDVSLFSAPFVRTVVCHFCVYIYIYIYIYGRVFVELRKNSRGSSRKASVVVVVVVVVVRF